MRLERASGILLHPTSLPGKFGIGDFGAEARSFIDFLHDSRQKLWQVMPLNPTGYGDSPYQSFSAFAGNTLLISPELLVEESLLERAELSRAPKFPRGRVDYGEVQKFKRTLLALAYRAFKRDAGQEAQNEFASFCAHAAWWLDDYALFRAIKDEHAGKSWNEWDAELRNRDAESLTRARAGLHDEMAAQQFYQYLFFRQWTRLRNYARERSVRVIGDVPLFVAYDSADVWTHTELFKLDRLKHPITVAGVPPDSFSSTGQLWGNPIYDWERMRADGFAWWRARIRMALQFFDILRFDHFRGFIACWEVPGADKTAERGSWVNVPGRELFGALRHQFGDFPAIAEDLGVITPEVERLREDAGLPGMRILQYAFGGGTGEARTNPHLPHNYVHNSVAYTGTHDNDTMLGWWNTRATTDDKGSALTPEAGYAARYVGIDDKRDAARKNVAKSKSPKLTQRSTDDARSVHRRFAQSIMSSVADTVILPLQDVLGLDNAARMNLPATVGGNWSWRYEKGALTEEVSSWLKELTEVYGRA